jgi:hypothetical protein
MDPTYLCITNITLFFSLLYFYLHSKKNIYEWCLAGLLILIIICSQLFWSNPIQDSLIHRIDAIVAKMSIICFILYIIFFKKHPWWGCFTALIIAVCITTTFYLSNHFSSIEWCSEPHILFHGLMHIFCYIGTFYAFY